MCIGCVLGHARLGFPDDIIFDMTPLTFMSANCTCYVGCSTFYSQSSPSRHLHLTYIKENYYTANRVSWYEALKLVSEGRTPKESHTL